MSARLTVTSLAEKVEATDAKLDAILAKLGGEDAPAEKPSRRNRSNKPTAAKLLPVGSTFEYRKGKKGSRQKWQTYEVVAHDGGRMAAMLAGSDSSFVSRWTPESMDKPYIRNVKLA